MPCPNQTTTVIHKTIREIKYDLLCEKSLLLSDLQLNLVSLLLLFSLNDCSIPVWFPYRGPSI